MTELTPMPAALAGTGLHYLAAGAGPAVVFVHGLGAFKEIWWSAVRTLAPTYRAVAFDLPGHGQSPPHERYAMSYLAEVVAASCAELGLAQITLVGHSMGGNVAARLALARPDLVRRLVLVDAALDMQYLARRSQVFIHPERGQRRLVWTRHISRPLARWGARVPHDHDGGLLRPLARRAHYVTSMQPAVVQSYIASLWQSTLSDELRAITQPTLVVTGDRDPMVARRQAEVAAELIPGAELAVVRRTLHNPMDERPMVFQALLKDFLQRRPPTI